MSGLTVAELHRDLTGGYSVALRLQQVPNSADDPAQVVFTAAVVASLGRGGPGPGDLEPVAAPCYPAAPAFTWASTPWFGSTAPGTVQPF
ncbi:MAG: hypothetical protein FWH11_11415 [Micrococcales bacterium]|nr:hypothetical protein [Micrococcales bacterium]